MNWLEDLKFINISKPEVGSTEELYLLSTGTVPSTLCIVSNNCNADKVLAYKANITSDTIIRGNQDSSYASFSQSLYLKEIEKVLTAVDGFSFEILFKCRKAFKVGLICMTDPTNPKTILEIPVEEIKASEGIMGLSMVGLNGRNISPSNTTSTKILNTSDGSLSTENKKLKKMLNDLIVEKNKFEDNMFRTFLKILNEKKRRLRDLKKIPTKVKPKTKSRTRGRQVIKSSSSSEEEVDMDETRLDLSSNDVSHNEDDEFNRETQIDEPLSPLTPAMDIASPLKAPPNPNAISPIKSSSYATNYKPPLALIDNEDDERTGSEMDFESEPLVMVSKVSKSIPATNIMSHHTKRNSKVIIFDDEEGGSNEDTSVRDSVLADPSVNTKNKRIDSSDTGDDLDDESLLQQFLKR